MVTCKNFPKRLELLFRTVLALPKASSSGLELMICCSTFASNPGEAEPGSEEAALGVPGDPGSPLTELAFWLKRTVR